ncbi:NepR family anti-sigma factor [Sphingomonas palmae]|uniref:NepR family anti-sigma factor n=1 Tax=Sphingomonas palmae TaxID=1855283 RepID=UPI0015A70BBA|nr:NepR family anti-sigma factor [Sphingomonas palmae]
MTSEKKLPDKPKKSTAAQSKNRDMGSALRSVYQKTVEETVPDDLMSLLGKLD